MAIDENPTEKAQEAVSPVAASPQSHRRGRGSVSENIGMTFKRVTERMRSTSRSRNKSPPMRAEIPPYESVPEFAFPRSASARSPVDGHGSEYFGNFSLPPPPPPPQPMEQVVSPIEGPQNPFSGYKHPREIRANMPPDTLQAGVYQPETPMI